MNNTIQLHTLRIGDWVIRQRLPDGEGPFPVIMLLHGWTGDENAMWVFAQRMPTGTVILAPRGIYPSPLGGYGWYPYRSRIWPGMDDFRPTLDELIELCTPVHFPQADFNRLHLVGFSQGAALVYAFVLSHASRLTSFTGLSGFLPVGAELLSVKDELKGKPAFIAHGDQDDLVPVDRARQAVRFFQSAGVKVTYCEDEVGHKLGANCFHGLEAFLANQVNAVK